MRCKNCRDKFDPIHFNAKYCSKDECRKVWIETAKVKQWIKEKKARKEKLETVQDLMKKAQKVFNTWIRKRDKGLNCISCGKADVGKRDASHYYSSGGHKSVTFNPDNVHASCVYCNQFLSGNLLNYQTGLTKRIGVERVFKLNEEAHKTRKFTREELKEIIKKYK